MEILIIITGALFVLRLLMLPSREKPHYKFKTCITLTKTGYKHIASTVIGYRSPPGLLKKEANWIVKSNSDWKMSDESTPKCQFLIQHWLYNFSRTWRISKEATKLFGVVIDARSQPRKCMHVISMAKTICWQYIKRPSG